MNGTVCVTVDVEDFYDGMGVLGHAVSGPRGAQGDLGELHTLVSSVMPRPAITLFVVGSYAPKIRSALAEFVADGHEIACHGPDHGLLPADGVVEWLRSGRLMLEDTMQIPITGMRSPRFDLPPGTSLAQYRDQIAEAGYAYVSDTSCMGASCPVRELPVLAWNRLPLGGGSYQRLVPWSVSAAAVRRGPNPAVLYYHSYDFDGSLPGIGAIRSPALAKQLLGRRRITPIFRRMVQQFGSKTCAQVAI